MRDTFELPQSKEQTKDVDWNIQAKDILCLASVWLGSLSFALFLGAVLLILLLKYAVPLPHLTWIQIGIILGAILLVESLVWFLFSVFGGDDLKKRILEISEASHPAHFNQGRNEQHVIQLGQNVRQPFRITSCSPHYSTVVGNPDYVPAFVVFTLESDFFGEFGSERSPETYRIDVDKIIFDTENTLGENQARFRHACAFTNGAVIWGNNFVVNHPALQQELLSHGFPPAPAE